MLEGKEIEAKIGQEGMYAVDVTAEGQVILELGYEKDFGAAKIKTANAVELSLFALLEALAKKTAVTWDDALVEQLKKILNIK